MLEEMRIVHVIGAALLGVGLVIVWIFDFRGRRARSLPEFAVSARRVALAYDASVVPGALVMLFSGGWMIATVYGSAFLEIPWLAGMVFLFLIEFVEGNTITRLFFIRMKSKSHRAITEKDTLRSLENDRKNTLSSLTHFLDIPIFILIVYMGIAKPMEWSTIALGGAMAVIVAIAQTGLFRPDIPAVDRALNADPSACQEGAETG